MFTMFEFFFAGIQSLYLYIACLNWIDNPRIHDILPSVPAAIALLIARASRWGNMPFEDVVRDLARDTDLGRVWESLGLDAGGSAPSEDD